MNNFLQQKSGFTLVELVVVLVLLGILSAFAIPKFFDLSVYRGQAAYDEVAGAVRYAQKLAVASGCEVRVVVFDNNYELQQCSELVGCTDGINTKCLDKDFDPIDDHVVTRGPEANVILTSTVGSFVFDAMGRCFPAVSVDIVDIDGGSRLSFDVIAETGYVMRNDDE